MKLYVIIYYCLQKNYPIHEQQFGQAKKGCLGRNISIEDAVKKSKKPTVLPIPLCMNYPIQKHRIIVYGIIYVCLFLCHILYEHRTDSALYLFNENS